MSARRGVGPWLTTGTLIGLTIVLVVWPAWWSYAVVFAAGAALVGLGQVLEHRAPDPDDAELTVDEARTLADDLGTELYRAQDALAFVAEMCDMADEHRGKRGEPATVTTTRVRDWLRGAQCARQAGLVLTPDSHSPTCADTPGIRGLLEHVGIDTTGRDITVSGRVVDAWTDPTAPGCPTPETHNWGCGCPTDRSEERP